MAARTVKKTPDQEQRNLVESLTAFGLPLDEQLLLVKGPNGRALRADEFAEVFAEEIKSGRAKANAQLGRALYDRALAGNVRALREWQKQSIAETVETRELAALLGVSGVVIAGMEKRGIIRKSAHGVYPLRETITAVVAHYREIAAGRADADPQSGGELVSQRARLARAQSEAIERKNDFERGKLIDIDEVIQHVTQCNRQVVSHILSFPSSHAAEIAACHEPREVHVLLTRLLREALEGLCQKFGS